MAQRKTSLTTNKNHSDIKNAPPIKVKVWDVPTRLFHWSVVFLVFISWITVDNGFIELHQLSGLTLLTLLIFRIIWGFVGSTTARFYDFVTTPWKAVHYLKALAASRKPAYAGHNPAGGWMVLCLMTLLGLQITLGLFANDDINFDGPLATLISKKLSDQMTGLHMVLFNIILLFIWAHVVAVFFYWCVKNDNLVWPMITGRKKVSDLPKNAKLYFVSPMIALVLVGLIAGFILLLGRAVGV